MGTMFTPLELDLIVQMARQELDRSTYLKLCGASPDDFYVASVATIGAKAKRMLQEMQEAARAKEHSHEPIQQRSEQVLQPDPDQREQSAE